MLNASYEPLSIVSSRRAICLLLADKAELVECDEGVVHSATVSIPVPAVVRLRYMVRVPRRAVAAVSGEPCSPVTSTAAGTAAPAPTRSTVVPARAAGRTSGRTSPPRAGRAT